MSIKISEMTLDSSIGGSEMIPVSDAGTAKRTSPAALAAYTIDQIEAVTAGTAVTGADSIFILQSGALKPVDIDLVSQYATDTMWGKVAETVADAADVLLLKDGGTTEKTVTLSVLSTYFTSSISSSLLNVSTLADGSGTLASTDYLLVTQGTTPKRITAGNLTDLIYTGLAAHVTAKSAVTTPTDTDTLYTLQGGTPKKLTLLQIVTHAVAAINAWAEIGADLVDADTFLVDDGGSGTRRKSDLSRLFTYIAGKMGLNAQTGTTYTLLLTDQSKSVRLTNASPVTMTVPPNSGVAFPIGTTIRLIQGGAGLVTVAQGSGVTVNTAGTLALAGQYTSRTLVKVDTNTWDLV